MKIIKKKLRSLTKNGATNLRLYKDLLKKKGSSFTKKNQAFKKI